MEDQPIDSILYARIGTDDVRFVALQASAPCTIEAALQDAGRHALVRAVPFCNSVLERVGTIVAVADITELRVAQRDPIRALPPNELSQRLDLLAQRLLTLVDGFVSLARAESTDVLAFEDFDLRDAVQDAYDEVWAAAQARNLSIIATVPEDSVAVCGDRQLLARAIVNLLNNAVKFSTETGTVQLFCLHGNREATVEIADQGPGIAPENVALLFRRFTRGLHRGTADPGGAGLGLAFVRVVTDKHRGRAWVETAEGYGAVFCLSIPATNPGDGYRAARSRMLECSHRAALRTIHIGRHGGRSMGHHTLHHGREVSQCQGALNSASPKAIVYLSSRIRTSTLEARIIRRTP